MADVHDVAAAVLAAAGPSSPMKLQKLLYYAQAWHLASHDRPLFEARIEAWSRGPVVPEVYRRHAGRTYVSAWEEGDPRRLAPAEAELVRSVVDRYGAFTRHQLSDMAHDEEPWKVARAGLPDSAPSTAPLSHSVMARYFRRLTTPVDDAVSEAVANVRLEGLDLSPEAVAEIRAVAAGRATADEAVARRIEALLKS
ncbi:type II toxin-antitoxin system antitoxin SocA domain-containing protein [Actinosynnema sp. NPDC020468]|uniref:type II toxin-antitoxin system antitoxin SocA domain-containing protein n=1 Tax=Actinosynnema sp. NPDC020468 TaxID=3154488 RepID=UPI0033C5873C